MKKIVYIFIAFMMIISSASAMTVNDLVWYHNQKCESFDALKITPDETSINGWLFCQATSHILVGYKIDEAMLIGGCTCDIDYELIQFLAQCVTVCTVIGNSNVDNYSGVILRQFLQVKTGTNTSMESAGDLLINVSESDGCYKMTAVTKGY